MPTTNKNHYIVQFGSGKPGEMGTQNTELEVFQKLGIKNPKIGFAPFHHILHDHPNDWKLFKDLIQPITKVEIELFEFHKEKNIEDLKHRISDCDVFVLGSGVCEPYLEYIFKNKLDSFFVDYFRSGKHLLGYSAGSISLSSRYIHVSFFREVLIFWGTLMQAPAQQQDEFKKSILEECPEHHRHTLEQLFKLQSLSEIMENPLCDQEFQSVSMQALELIPNMVMLPHYNEAIHATEAHLRASVNRYSRYRHFGIPNGAALFHTFNQGKLLKSEVVGQNPNSKLHVTEFLKKDTRTYKVGEEINLA